MSDGEQVLDTIVVTAQVRRGSVDTEQAPIAELNEDDIAAIGAGSISELVEALQGQTGSSRGRGGGGRPVFLINGIRVASFREFFSYPPEAIERLEILPEEVAQRFGFPPDRRVVNFILKDDFSSREVELEYAQPDRGGFSQTEQEFTLLRIQDGARINLSLEFNDTSLLTEAERGVVQAGGIAAAPFRSLVADSSSIEATANYAKAFLDSGSSITGNATYQQAESRSLNGLATLDPATALERTTTSDTFLAAASYNRPVGDFQLTATADGSYADARTRIDRPDGGFDTALTDSYAASALATLRGTLADLPAGDLSLTLDAGYDWNRIESEDSRTVPPVSLTRGDVSAGANIVVPVASRRRGVWDAVGDVTLSAQAGVNRLSDFGTLYDWTAGLNWQPTGTLELQATYVYTEVAPGLSQLGAPSVTSFNVPVFDFAAGQNVLVDVVTGGNPFLLAETQRDLKLSAQWALPFWEDARLRTEYIRNRSDDVTASFPLLTPAIETTFADRVTRAGDGTLRAIDSRPVTYAATRADRLVFELTGRGDVGRDDEEAGGRGRGGPPNPFARREQGGRYFVNLRHSIELANEVLVAPGSPLLDQLNGEALDATGAVRQTSSLEAGLFMNGYGLRLSGDYVGETSVLGSVPGVGADDLFFGELATFDIDLFADLGRVFDREQGFLKGLRISFEVENLFDARRLVTDGTGAVPFAYQPFLIDPVGRLIGLELRKLF